MVVEERSSYTVHSLNPIRFNVSGVGAGNTVRVQIYPGSMAESVYLSFTPDANGRVSFDISEIVHTFLTSLDVEFNYYIYQIGVFNPKFVRDVHLLFSEFKDGTFISGGVASITCYYGGVSDKALRYLRSINQTIFDYRLMNYERQFLFTTRTNSRNIRLRESELHPFHFILPEGTIQIRTQNGKILNPFYSLSPGTFCAINPIAIRKYFYDTYGQTVFRFGLFLNGNCVSIISIEPSAQSVDRLILRFRNSLGCYEQIEVTGRAEHAPEFDEERLYGVYDSITEDFVENRFRRSYNDVINASAGYKSPDELNFIRELLSSDDTYLLDDEIGKMKVNVSAENFTMQINPYEPQTVDLIIRIADREELITPTFNYTDEEFEWDFGWFEPGHLFGKGKILEHSTIHTI